jgi:hypothetical protein
MKTLLMFLFMLKFSRRKSIELSNNYFTTFFVFPRHTQSYETPENHMRVSSLPIVNVNYENLSLSF